MIVPVSINFPTNSKWDALFYHIVHYYVFADWGGPHGHLRDVPWEDFLKISASARAS